MRKSELIENLVDHFQNLPVQDVKLAVKSIIEHMTEALQSGNRIEIRGFGSFSLHYRAPRIGRNPMTGEEVKIPARWVPVFKAGSVLKDSVCKTKRT